jgi:hypothetical protein
LKKLSEVAYALINGVKYQEVKQHILVGGKRSHNEYVNQAQKLEAVKATAKSTSDVAGGRAGAEMGTWSPVSLL